MSYLRYLCLFAYSGVQYISCFAFFCFAYLRLVHYVPVVPSFFLDCSFLMAPSVFSNV